MMKDTKWELPEIKEIGKAEDLIQNIDTDGVGDSVFPLNLASS
tara:strand:+ start:516 stop:644 length:129 start_codon:yes stop_codon:yes gene_type:complete